MKTTSQTASNARRFAAAAAALTGAALVLIGCGSGSLLQDLETTGSKSSNEPVAETPTTTESAPATTAAAPTKPIATAGTTPVATAPTKPVATAGTTPVATAPKPVETARKLVHPLQNVKVGDCMSAAATDAAGISKARTQQPCGTPAAATKVTKTANVPGLACANGEASYSQTLSSGTSTATVALCLARADDRDNVLAIGSCLNTRAGEAANTIDLSERNCADPEVNAVVAGSIAAGAKCPVGTLHAIEQKANEVSGPLGRWCLRSK